MWMQANQRAYTGLPTQNPLRLPIPKGDELI